MTAPFAPLRRALSFALLASAIIFAISQARAAQVISVRVDQARIEKLPEHATTLVVGNPLIADVSLQQGGLMVLTGKGFGTTNLIALDKNGAVLSEQIIEVKGPSDSVVVVYRGTARETYSCTPACERRITLGDSPEFFDATIGQAGTRSARASGAGAATTQGNAAR